MKERRLKENWKLEQKITDSGHETRVPVYTGNYYRFENDPRSLLIAGCAGLILYLMVAVLFMLLKLRGTYCIYVLPVFLCGLIPGVYWAMGLFTMWRNPSRMTVVQKEKGPARVLRSALGCGIFTSMSFIGDCILLLTQHPENEWIDAILLALASGCAITVFNRFRNACAHISEEKGSKQA